MPTIFTRIIQGDLPGRFVWKDDHVVAFLTISPIKPGHTLVVPRREVDHWIDMEPDLARHVMDVSVAVGRAIQNWVASVIAPRCSRRTRACTITARP